MKTRINRKRFIAVAMCAVLLWGGSGTSVSANTLQYSNGFETDTERWVASGTSTITRVASGTDDITSKAGEYHAIVVKGEGSSGPYTDFGGYQSTWKGDWTARLDVYLDPTWATGSAFLYSVASNDTSGVHMREYVLHAGVIHDETTGGVPQLVVIADTSGVPGADPLEHINAMPVDRRAVIASAGWYTIEQQFRSMNSKLVGTVRLLNADGVEVFSYTKPEDAFTNGYDLIENTGGNRYGWFTHITVPGGLAIDSAELMISSVAHSIDTDAKDDVSVVLDDAQELVFLGVATGSTLVPVAVQVTGQTTGVEMTIPASTTIAADDVNWDGVFPAPVSESVSLSFPNLTTTVAMAVKIGLDTPMAFDQPIKILLPGHAGKKAGYFDATDTFHTIETACGVNPAITLTDPVVDCFRDEGSDLAIYTKHLTVFVAYTTTASSSGSSSRSGGGGVRYGCQDPLATNYNEASRHRQELCTYGDTTSAPGVPSTTFVRDLDLGITGEDVRELQQYLNAAGYLVALTGPGSVGNETDMFGYATQAALARFQQAHGIIPAVGYFGPVTRAVLAGSDVTAPQGTSVSVTQDLAYGMSGSEVHALQSILAAHAAGPRAQELAATGLTTWFGPLTQAALIEYQSAHGITPAAGYFGPLTRAHMQSTGLLD